MGKAADNMSPWWEDWLAPCGLWTSVISLLHMCRGFAKGDIEFAAGGFMTLVCAVAILVWIASRQLGRKGKKTEGLKEADMESFDVTFYKDVHYKDLQKVVDYLEIKGGIRDAPLISLIHLSQNIDKFKEGKMMIFFDPKDPENIQVWGGSSDNSLHDAISEFEREEGIGDEGKTSKT